MHVCNFYVCLADHLYDILRVLQLEENFLLYVRYLIQNYDSKFWRNGRFLVNAGSQLASHKDGEYCDWHQPVSFCFGLHISIFILILWIISNQIFKY